MLLLSRGFDLVPLLEDFSHSEYTIMQNLNLAFLELYEGAQQSTWESIEICSNLQREIVIEIYPLPLF